MKVAVACLLFLLPAVGLVAQVVDQATHAATENTLTIKVEAPPQRPQFTTFGEYIGAASELLRAVAWPFVFVVLVLTQRRPLGSFLEAVVELLQHSNHIKLGDMIDVEVSRNAKEAAARETPADEATPSEIEAAARVGRMAEPSDLPTIRARILEYAREYEATRSSMKSGPSRTQAMNAVVAKMRTLGIAAEPLLRELTNDKLSPGKRLAALAILQLAPDLGQVDWIVERMGQEQPFLLFHASLALLSMVRSFGVQSRNVLEPALRRSLELVRSFSGGHPDHNTVETLQLAMNELKGHPQA